MIWSLSHGSELDPTPLDRVLGLYFGRRPAAMNEERFERLRAWTVGNNFSKGDRT